MDKQIATKNEARVSPLKLRALMPLLSSAPAGQPSPPAETPVNCSDKTNHVLLRKSLPIPIGSSACAKWTFKHSLKMLRRK